jgi:hypothetical protein
VDRANQNQRGKHASLRSHSRYNRIERQRRLGAAARQPVDAFWPAPRPRAFDFTGTLARCASARPQPARTSHLRPPARATWYTDPGKVFDNLYFVGTKIHSAWALTTSEGIILIDGLRLQFEEAIVEGMKKLGLDPPT